MADDSLPTEYDAIVLGTGMTECIIAAALSRIGQRVLHLDRNDYYSGDWGTFHFEALQKWIAKQQGTESEKLNIKAPKEDLLKEDEATIPFKVESTTVSNVKENVLIPEELPLIEAAVEEEKKEVKLETEHASESESLENNEEKPESESEGPKTQNTEGCEGTETNEEDKAEKTDSAATVKEEEPEKKEWCFSEIKKQWRKFNIDLQPKMLYCRGPMVELLISSDIAKYCEFKSITRILTLLDDKLQQVPCSRSDVFSSRQVSMIEKRMLMKLLTFCMEYDKNPQEYEGFEDKPFDEFLGARKLTANVRHYVKYAIAMATDTTSTIEGLKSTQKFLQSLGRYGNTAFLWPLYGSGEMPQCFCRMCAVFGGIYCLRRTGVSMIVDKEKKCKGIVDSEGQRLDAKWIVVESSYTAGELAPKGKPSSISRGIFVIDRSLHATDSEHISLLNLPPCEGQATTVSVIELSPISMACPKDTYLVHMTCTGSAGPEEDFAVPMKKLFQSPDPASRSADDGRPVVLWSLFFSQEDTTPLPLNDHGLEGVFVVGTPDGQLDFDHSIQEARGIFEKICPGEEFLPRAPNPEDIIYDDDQQGPNAEGSGFEPAKEGETGQEKKEGEEETKDGQEKKEDVEKKQEGQEKTSEEGVTPPTAAMVSEPKVECSENDTKETVGKEQSSSTPES